MLREYTKALFKRVDADQLMQFKPPTLPQRIYTRTLFIDNAHYSAYCQEVDWPASNTIHPLYLQTLSLPLQMQCLLDKQSPFPLLGLIHAANQITMVNECDFSEPFECRVRFHDVHPHQRGWEVDVLLEAWQSGKVVYRAVSSYLVKVKAVHVAPRAVSGEISAECDTQEKTLINEMNATSNTGRRYAKISGDYNPIHLSGVSAKAFGFKKPIAHGMWTLARAISAFVAHQDNPDACHLKDITCQFKKPVFLPNHIHVLQHCKTPTKALVDVTNEDESVTHVEVSITY